MPLACVFNSPPLRGGVDAASSKSCEATESAADGVVSSAKSSGLNSFAELTTPAAPFGTDPFLLMARPPLLAEEGNIYRISQHCQFIHNLKNLLRNRFFRWRFPDRRQQCTVTSSFQQHVVPLHWIPGIPERSAHEHRLAFARPLHHDARRPRFRILALEPCISPHTNLGGQRSQCLGLERRCAIEFHQPVWR